MTARVPAQLADSVRQQLHASYGITATALTAAAPGTATHNLQADTGRGPLFIKIYPQLSTGDLEVEEQAIGLCEYAAQHGLPTPAVHRTRTGRVISTGTLAMSIWTYVAHTASGHTGLAGPQWESSGHLTGSLHRILADHPAAAPSLEPGHQALDLARARIRFARIIHGLTTLPRPRTAFEDWALDAARERQALLPRVAAWLQQLPPLTVQVVHGDLASPNLLFQHDEVAALVDFRPPAAGYAAAETARLATDPASILASTDWPDAIARFAAAYRTAHPHARADDLRHLVAIGAGAIICSGYPLSETLDRPDQTVTDRTAAYGRARQAAVQAMLARLPEATGALHGR